MRIMEQRTECEVKKTFGRAPISALLNEEVEPFAALPAQKPILNGISDGLGTADSSSFDEPASPLANVDFNLELMANVADSVPRLQVVHPMVHEGASNVATTNKVTSSATESIFIRNVISPRSSSSTPVVNVLGYTNTGCFTISDDHNRAQLETPYPQAKPSFGQSQVHRRDMQNACNGHGFHAALNALRGPRSSRKVRQARSTGDRAGTSKYCHICNRREKQVEKHIPCGNFARQICGKSICTKCFSKVWWPGRVDLATARAQGPNWSCPHCLGVCGLVRGRTATCVYYGRTTDKRRKQNMLESAIYKRRYDRQGDDGTV